MIHNVEQYEAGFSSKNKELSRDMISTIIYEAAVNSTNANITVSSKRYVDFTERNFKTRFNNHTLSFRH